AARHVQLAAPAHLERVVLHDLVAHRVAPRLLLSLLVLVGVLAPLLAAADADPLVAGDVDLAPPVARARRLVPSEERLVAVDLLDLVPADGVVLVSEHGRDVIAELAVLAALPDLLGIVVLRGDRDPPVAPARVAGGVVEAHVALAGARRASGPRPRARRDARLVHPRGVVDATGRDVL